MKKLYALSLGLLCALTNSFGQLTVDTNATPAGLVNAIAAGGIAVSNISYTGVQHASGTFICSGPCNLGIAGGIILTSGNADIATLQNTQSGQGLANLLTTTDPDLSSLTTGITYDVTLLEFDFLAISDTVEFNYIFASEEYSDYVNTAFNDVFGFFISGPGITGMQNIALVPGTNIPIAINNVNNGMATHGTLPPGPCEYCQYFIDNTVPVAYTTAYDGMTTVLNASATGIQPGQTYHLKIAIGDVSDGVFDSGVFLEAGTFRIIGPPAIYVGGNRITNTTVHICNGASASLSVPAGFTYMWSTGETTQSITVSTAGTYFATITGTNINYPVVTDPVTFIVDNTNVPTPVLSFANNTISSSVTSGTYSYSWTFNGMPIAGAITPSVPAAQSGCYAVTVQDPGGCFTTSDTLCIIPTGINEIASSNNVTLYPNPFDQSATLIFDNPFKNNFTLKIMDLAGRELRSIENIFTNSLLIEKGTLNQGIYFYQLINQTKQTLVKGKMVIQ